MKSVLLFALFLFVVSAFQDHLNQQFDIYVKQFHKKYRDDGEYQTRFLNFNESLIRIHRLNSLSKHAKFGLNKFSDMSREEFASKRLQKVKVSGSALALSCLANGVTAEPVEMDLPTSFDWRTKKVVTAVKDQGECGSCWAFSTIGNIESQWAIKGHPLTQFSEQLLVDCSHGCSNEPPYGPVCNSGCDGGWQWNAYSDILSWRGVEKESQYAYTGVDGTCEFNAKYVQAPITNYTCLTNPNTTGVDETKMASFLVQNGPLAIAMDASLLQDYSSGIIDFWVWVGDCSDTELDHALLVVGFGQEVSEIWGTTLFWIIKNSWSSTWGESGYFRIVRGKGACGLNTAVSTVVM